MDVCSPVDRSDPAQTLNFEERNFKKRHCLCRLNGALCDPNEIIILKQSARLKSTMAVPGMVVSSSDTEILSLADPHRFLLVHSPFSGWLSIQQVQYSRRIPLQTQIPLSPQSTPHTVWAIQRLQRFSLMIFMHTPAIRAISLLMELNLIRLLERTSKFPWVVLREVSFQNLLTKRSLVDFCRIVFKQTDTSNWQIFKA